MRTYKTEFPDFPEERDLVMAFAKKGLGDLSYRNDACPCFGDYRMLVWVDYPRPEDRENGGKRFIVCPTNMSTPSALETDDVAELLKFLEDYDG
jgi:hypothetical protein